MVPLACFEGPGPAHPNMEELCIGGLSRSLASSASLFTYFLSKPASKGPLKVFLQKQLLHIVTRRSHLMTENTLSLARGAASKLPDEALQMLKQFKHFQRLIVQDPWYEIAIQNDGFRDTLQFFAVVCTAYRPATSSGEQCGETRPDTRTVRCLLESLQRARRAVANCITTAEEYIKPIVDNFDDLLNPTLFSEPKDTEFEKIEEVDLSKNGLQFLRSCWMPVEATIQQVNKYTLLRYGF